VIPEVTRRGSFGDIHRTIFSVLAVDPSQHFLDHSGRPVVAVDHGAVIGELF